MMKIQTYEEMKELYIKLDSWNIEDIEPEYRKSRRSLDAARSLWDNNNSKWMGEAIDGDYIIPHLQSKLGAYDRHIKSRFPWGYFRNLFDSNTKHEKMYSTLVDRAHESIGGSSIYQEGLYIFKRNIENNNIKPIKEQWLRNDELKLKDLSLGFYLMLFRSTMGIAYENRVLKSLSKIVNSFGGWEAIEADSDLECEDIDVVLKNGTKKVMVSVKCFGAFSNRIIGQKRAKGKTRPELYAGVRDIATDKLLIAEYNDNNFDYIEGKEALKAFLSSL